MICSLSTCRAQDLQTLARRTKRSVGIGAGSITGGRPRALVVRTVKKPGHLGDQHDAGTEFLTLMLLQMTPLVSVKPLRTNPTCRTRYISCNVDIESHGRKQEHMTKNIGGCCPMMFH